MTKYLLWALLMAAPVFSQSLEPLSNITLENKNSNFHSLSGIEILDNGAEFVAVSDKGTIWKGELIRDENGAITRAQNIEGQSILTSKSEPVKGNDIDAESITQARDGSFYIGFESNTRISKFRDWNSPAILLPRPADFLEWGYNSGPEAITAGPNDAIFVVPERSGKLDRPFPIWVFENQKWRIQYYIPRKPPFLVVGLDYDPKTNRLYVLERRFDNFVLANRIRSFTLGKDTLTNEKTLLENSFSPYGNIEGISIWYDKNNRSILTLVTDNNNLRFFNTKLIEFIVKENAPNP